MASNDVNQWLTAARAAYAQGNIEQARRLVKQVLSVNGEHPEAWLLVTYLTTNPEQQRVALNHAKHAAPQDERIRQREAELFPRRKAQGVFVPDDPAFPPQIIESAGGMPSTPRSVPPRTEPRPVPDPVPVRQQVAPPLPGPPMAEGPTLADGVVVKPRLRLMAYMPMLVAGGVLILCAVLGLGYNALNQRALQNSPSAIVMKFYPALQAGDNATLDAILSDDAKALCGDNLAVCLGQRSPIARFQNFAVSDENLGNTDATVTLRFSDAQTLLCETFYTQKINGDWKIVKDDAPLPCSGAVPNAALPSLAAVTPSETVTLDATQQGVLQTSTRLAQTQNAMLAAPTLTAAVLAPGFTQTALSGKQNGLNTAIAATGTQAVVAVSQTAVVVGLTTSTPLAQTQSAATSTQAAVAFISTLKGVLVTSRTIQNKPTLVTVHADGTGETSLNVIGSDPLWSADGTRIAYTNREHEAWVHIVNADGSHDLELPSKTGMPFGTGWASWSADVQQIMFEGSLRLGLHAVFIGSIDGATTTQILDDTQSGGWTSWSPDGSQLLDEKDDQVWQVEVRSGTAHSLAKQPGARAAVWSPDSKQIAFDAGGDQDRGVYTMNADGSGLQRLTPPSVYSGFPTWSSDGSHLAALCFDGRTNSYQVCVMNSDGSHLTNITVDGGFDGRISWRK